MGPPGIPSNPLHRTLGFSVCFVYRRVTSCYGVHPNVGLLFSVSAFLRYARVLSVRFVPIPLDMDHRTAGVGSWGGFSLRVGPSSRSARAPGGAHLSGLCSCSAHGPYIVRQNGGRSCAAPVPLQRAVFSPP